MDSKYVFTPLIFGLKTRYRNSSSGLFVLIYIMSYLIQLIFFVGGLVCYKQTQNLHNFKIETLIWKINQAPLQTSYDTITDGHQNGYSDYF